MFLIFIKSKNIAANIVVLYHQTIKIQWSMMSINWQNAKKKPSEYFTNNTKSLTSVKSVSFTIQCDKFSLKQCIFLLFIYLLFIIYL